MDPKLLELEIERALRDNDDQLALGLMKLAKTRGVIPNPQEQEPPAPLDYESWGGAPARHGLCR